MISNCDSQLLSWPSRSMLVWQGCPRNIALARPFLHIQQVCGASKTTKGPGRHKLQGLDSKRKPKPCCATDSERKTKVLQSLSHLPSCWQARKQTLLGSRSNQSEKRACSGASLVSLALSPRRAQLLATF